MESDQTGKDYCIMLCTCPDQVSAEKIASSLIENKLAACVNIVPGLISIYQWKGNIEKDQELLLVIKSKPVVFETVKKAILELHPYELPEIISIPLLNGFSNYLSWIDENVGGNGTESAS